MTPAPEKHPVKAPVEIRRAEASDIDGIAKLEKAGFGETAWPRDILEAYVQASIEDPVNVPLFVAFTRAANGKTEIAGYTIGVVGGKDNGMILDLNVAQEFKGRHLGRELLERVSESLKNAGATELTLEVESTNKAAIKLYESVGFIKDHILPDYYGAKRDAYWMTTKLSKPSAPKP